MDSDSSDSDEDDESGPLALQLHRVSHEGVVNRIRAMRQNPLICASWADIGHVQVSNEEGNSVEIAKLRKIMKFLTLELEAAKLATINEFNKNRVLERQLELLVKEKSALESGVFFTELRNKNILLEDNVILLRSSLNGLAERNSMLEYELSKTKEGANNTISKLWEVEKTCSQLQLNIRSMEEKMSNLEGENHIMCQKALNVVSPKNKRAGFVKPLLDESTTPSKFIAPLSQGFSDSRRKKSRIERH